MPLTVNVGLSKKVGLPDYGSLGASCNVQFELDSSLLQQDLETFQRRVRQAYVACSQAVGDELARQQSGGDSQRSQEASSTGQSNGQDGYRASDKQLDYVRQLAGQIRGLGVRRLEGLSGKMFGKPLAEINSVEASSLIDTLKAIKSGQIRLEDALDGASS